jgi:hypothetical protein
MPTVARATLHNGTAQPSEISIVVAGDVSAPLGYSLCLFASHFFSRAKRNRVSLAPSRIHAETADREGNESEFFIWLNNGNKTLARVPMYVIFLFHFLSYFRGNIVDWRKNCINGARRDRFNQACIIFLLLELPLQLKLILGLTSHKPHILSGNLILAPVFFSFYRVPFTI